MIASKHKQLLHAGTTLVAAPPSRNVCIMNGRRLIRSIVQHCVKRRHTSARPKNEIFGQLPMDRLKLGLAFGRVGIEYAGPKLVESESV